MMALLRIQNSHRRFAYQNRVNIPIKYTRRVSVTSPVSPQAAPWVMLKEPASKASTVYSNVGGSGGSAVVSGSAVRLSEAGGESRKVLTLMRAGSWPRLLCVGNSL